MIGCSTIHTRLSSSPGEVEELFPSTRRTAQYFSQEFSDLEISQDPYVTAFLIAPVLFVYSLVEYVPAIATDVVLLPMDAYNISRKSAKERQEREEFLTQQQEERIEPVKWAYPCGQAPFERSPKYQIYQDWLQPRPMVYTWVQQYLEKKL